MRRILAFLLGALFLVTGCSKPPQANLLIPIDALCTTCEDFVRCDASSGNAAVYDPTFNLYYLKPKGIGAQIATIWTFFIQMVHPKTEDERPLAVYAQRAGQTKAIDRESQAETTTHIDLIQHRMNVPEGWVDQATGAWHAADGSVRGSCRLLSKPDGRALLALFQKPAAP